MEINTKAYGLVEVGEENIITFEKGIIGFEEKQKYVLLGNPEKEDFLIWLQSVDDEKLAFIIIPPHFVKADYKPIIPSEELEDLEIKDNEDLLFYTIVVIPEDIKKMRTNLKAPLIINTKNNKAKQLILNDDRYQVKEWIFPQNED